MAGKGANLQHTLGANPDPVSVVLELGATRYCMSFGTSTGATAKFSAGSTFSAKRASAPPECPP